MKFGARFIKHRVCSHLLIDGRWRGDRGLVEGWGRRSPCGDRFGGGGVRTELPGVRLEGEVGIAWCVAGPCDCQSHY